MQGLLRSLQHKSCSRAFHHSHWQHQSVVGKLSLLAAQGRLKEAIQILHHSNETCFRISSETYVSLVRSCIRFKAFTEGHKIHKHIIDSGVQLDVVLQNNLMILYSKCGDVKVIRRIFDEMSERNLFSWTAIIGAYLNSGNAAGAFEFYQKMVLTGTRADHFLYPLVFKSCSGMRALDRGRRVHTDVTKGGFHWDLVVMNSLLDMYAKCESVVDAEKVFDEIVVRDVFTWTSMLVGYVQMGHSLEALNFLKEMLFSEVRPCSATLAGILPVFSDLGCFKLSRQIHGLIVASGFELDRFVASGIIDMYVNCGGLGYGRLIFDRVKERDIVCWNTMIKSYANKDLLDEAIELLLQMHSYGVNPNKTTWDCLILPFLQNRSITDVLDLFNRLLRVGLRSSSLSMMVLSRMTEAVTDIEQVRELHGFISRGGYISSDAEASSLVEMYSKFGDVEVSQGIFNSLSVKELHSWNSMISCYSKNGHPDKALELFHLMQTAGMKPNIVSWNYVVGGFVENSYFNTALEMFAEMQWLNQKPDITTFNVMLPVVVSLTCSLQGKQLHSIFLRNNCEMNRFVCTAFINMYSNCGNIAYAVKLFESMATKDLAAWNTMISGLAKNAFLEEASKTFHDMETTGVKANIITWTSLISGYVQNGQVDESFKHFRQLQYDGLRPNSITIVSILPACAQSVTLSHGRTVHGYIVRSGLGCNDLFVANALMDMYVKCGRMDYAEHVFRRLPKMDVVSWNTMIQGYAIHGDADTSLALFDQMPVKGVIPDAVTFIGVLSACGHRGLIEEGWKHFNSMNSKYGILPSGKHYACMVDLLGRGGHFEDIRHFIIQMPLRPTASFWGALLSSCNIHGNVEMAEYAADRLLELQPENPGNYVILSNIYASLGRWKDVDHMRNLMIDRGVRKQPGSSWIEVGNHVHAFTVENLLSTGMEEVVRMLQDLVGAMVEEGYAPLTQEGNPE
ncbi:hypothetical protein MRB53_029188 [Persea americana]|uniref:Uncharacterized protein n=1 Tax=Persea americana TaxID=3435 RepID=A0ACC2KHN0_PERAE|nr:hypothetical protein MRB53_029188 [Persea americana]